AWDLRTNIEDETARALLTPHLEADRLADLYPGYPFDDHPVILAEDPDGSRLTDPDIPAPAGDPAGDTAAEAGAGSAENVDFSALTDLLTRVDALVGGAGEGIGSNSWVVSGE